MQVTLNGCRLELAIGDITTETTAAIVNAANAELAGGGGVDGAIHQAAGPDVMQQLRDNYPHGCPPGQAAVTSAGRLAARYIFHAVGPIWQGGRSGEEPILRNAYRSCLELAIELGCDDIAFPAISTGIYGYPLDLAATAAIAEISEFLKQHGQPKRVRCILYHEGIYGAFGRVLETVPPS